jgi:antitoxin component of RelBE/YafQ-DinJ toxin-antitoxin module
MNRPYGSLWLYYYLLSVAQSAMLYGTTFCEGVPMDRMVTARMSQGKKERGTATLSRLGTNASAAINALFDFVIENGRLPFSKPARLGADEIVDRIALVDSIPLYPENRFAQMDDDEIKRERLGMGKGKG